MDYLKKINKNATYFKGKEYFKYCFLIFIIGGVMGFIMEFLYNGIFINIWKKPGFLYGPFVPIYGYGALLILIFLKRFKKNPFTFNLLTMLVTGVLEYLTGYYMLLIWNQRWWDYSHLFLNINGHVCLMSVMQFAFVGSIFIYILEPIINNIYQKMTKNEYNFIAISFIIIYLVDNVLSFLIKNQI